MYNTPLFSFTGSPLAALRSTILGGLIIFTVLFLGALPAMAQQQISDSSFVKIQRVYRQRQLNIQYSECYKSFADVTWMTLPYTEVGGPRYYLLTGMLQPYFMVLAAKWSPVAIAIEPRVGVRIMTGTSSPVRTPSFNPGMTMYYRLWNDTTHLFYLSASLFHHSNGQDGPTLDPKDSTEPRKMNTYNGSFATNYWAAGLNYSQTITRRKLSYNMNGRVEVEHHIFGIDEGLKGRFGNVRLNLKFTAIALGKNTERIKIGRRLRAILREDDLVEMFRLTFGATFILDKFTGPESNMLYRRMNVEIKAMYRIPGSPNVSVLLAGGYYGQDPYNIYLQDHYGYFRVGLATGFFIYRLFPERIKVPKNKKELRLEGEFKGVERK
ncbi:MAG: hypothetical protein KA149_08665 [Chitinophagales bacterium]|nr:hypothetical protein [Chitinophagales bacterium]